MNRTSQASVVSDIVLESPVHVVLCGQWSVIFEKRINIIFETMYIYNRKWIILPKYSIF